MEEVSNEAPPPRKLAPGEIRGILRDKNTVKPKRNIRFATGAELNKIKYFKTEESVGDEAYEGSGLSARESEMDEGRFMHGLSAAIDWETPKPIAAAVIPSRGKNSTEVEFHDLRERRVIGVTYMTERDIPPTPAEPDFETAEGERVSTVNIPLYDLSDPEQEAMVRTRQQQLMQQILMPAVPAPAPVANGLDLGALQALLSGGLGATQGAGLV
ncbi:hypothetical protein HDU67_006014, partial [Dinochytrium kinnereticum]